MDYFTIEELNNSIRVDYKGIEITILCNKEDARSKEEILYLLNNNKETYSCMCSVKTKMPFSHVENMTLKEGLNRNLIALEKLIKIEEFKNKNFDEKIEVYLKKYEGDIR